MLIISHLDAWGPFESWGINGKSSIPEKEAGVIAQIKEHVEELNSVGVAISLYGLWMIEGENPEAHVYMMSTPDPEEKVVDEAWVKETFPRLMAHPLMQRLTKTTLGRDV